MTRRAKVVTIVVVMALGLIAAASWAGYELVIAVRAGRWVDIACGLLFAFPPAWLARDAVLHGKRDDR